MSEWTTVAVFGAHGKTGRAVSAALAARGAGVVGLGRSQWPRLASVVAGCDAAYLIAPNLHPDEPAYVAAALDALRAAGVPRVVYHSVAAPYAPDLPHHLGKAVAEDLVRRSGLAWTVLQPGAYLQNLDLTSGRPLTVSYRLDAPFGFLDLADLAAAAATVLLEPGHVGATYELASVASTVGELTAAAGVVATVVPYAESPALSERENAWLAAMFAYYDRYGLPVGSRTLRALLGR